MAKTLVIAEKPSVARDIVAALPGSFQRHDAYHESVDWIVTYAIGHLVTLAAPEEYDEGLKKWRAEDLPIAPAVFKLKPASDGARKQLVEIHKLLQRPDVEKVVNACDAGREGELIFALIYELCKATQPVERLWISSMTKAAIETGFANLRAGVEMRPLEDAARSRSEADWLVGMNGTRAATIRARGHLEGVVSLGRVQTPTLALIVKRDLEIRAFGSATYYVLRAGFATLPAAKIESQGYHGLWISTDPARLGSETRIEDKAVTEALALKVAGKEARVLSVEKKAASEKAPLLYDLTTLQRDANKRFGFSAEQTLKAAQSLYETRKALTYPRTDSRYLTTDMKPLLKKAARTLEPFSEYAAAVAYVAALTEIPARIIDDKKVSDHHAIIPTDVGFNRSGWSEDELKVFDLVARRFLAVFHPDAEYEKTTILTEVEDERFRTRGKVTLKPGWRAVYDALPEDAEEKKEADEEEGEGTELPALHKGQPLTTVAAEVEEKKTKPPAHFNEASLLGAMETAGKAIEDDELREAMKAGGLGTPATRAAIIETLLRRDYILRKGKRLLATEKGTGVIELLGEHKLASPELTGEWEKRLSEMAAGEFERSTFMAMIKRFTAEDIVQGIAGLSSAALGAPPVEDLCACPRCAAAGELHRISERPKSFSCSSWVSAEEPGCGFVLWSVIAGRHLSGPEALQLIEKGKTDEVLEGFTSKAGRLFTAALKLDEEGNVVFDFPPKEDVAADADDSLGSCPTCQKGIIATGKAYSCSSWRSKEEPGCGWKVWKEIAKHQVTTAELEQLLATGRTAALVSDLVSKKGSSFAATLVLAEDGKLTFEFEQKGPARPKLSASGIAYEERPPALAAAAREPAAGSGGFEEDNPFPPGE